MTRRGEASGIYVPVGTVGEVAHAFVPTGLPPKPPVELVGRVQELHEQATLALGRLDGISTLLPDTSLFIYMYVRKEAVLSSQIEGTQSSLSDLLLFEMDEMPGVPLDDVAEVSSYVAALHHGLKRLREDAFPLSSRLIREIHAVLMQTGRGSDKRPGEFRRSQNWIGGTRPGNAHFVPPPHTYVHELIADLERYLHAPSHDAPTLIKAGIAHAQFETIHPFLDGNGRLGRLLITLLLCSENVLEEPMLYLSLYFKAHRDAYYTHLDRVRTEGAWEDWLGFFFEGVRDAAQQAVATARRLLSLIQRDRERIEGIGRRRGSALQLHEYLQRHVFVRAPEATSTLPLSGPTVRSAISALEEIELLREITGKGRNRVWVYREYLDILSEGM